MQLIDAHVHLRSGKLSRVRPRISAEAALQLLLEDMARAGVDTSLLVTWAEDVPVVAREAAVQPGRLYSLVWFDSRNPMESLSHLVSLADQFPSVVIGAKTVFPYLRQHPLQPEFMPLYAFCQDRRLPIQFHFGGSPVMEALCHAQPVRSTGAGISPVDDRMSTYGWRLVARTAAASASSPEYLRGDRVPATS